MDKHPQDLDGRAVTMSMGNTGENSLRTSGRLYTQGTKSDGEPSLYSIRSGKTSEMYRNKRIQHER